jgi:hypothetical protein
MKELTDEEILDIAKENTFEFGEIPPVQFARAILKKASETCNGFCGEYECKENQANCKRIKE